ncbi:MAG TPA: histidine kinase [Anaeromyxobacter sp.]|nr:histidine kinase [Anaeromyxobacter sp.]
MATEDRSERLAATLRFAAAATAVAIFVADPSEHPARRPLAHGVLTAFAVYSAVSYVVAVRRGRTLGTAILPWVDVAWVTVAVAASQATSGIFYPLYLFAVLSASFWGGVQRGLAVAGTSALAFALVGATTAPPGVDLRLFLVRPLYLLVLGTLIAIWVGHEVRAHARLALLRDVTALSTQEHSLDGMIGRFLEAVRAFFDADSCRLVVADDRAGAWTRVAVRGRGVDPARTPVPADLARVLLPAPAGAVLVTRPTLAGVECFPAALGSPDELEPAAGAALLSALDARALLSVPFRFHASAPARVHVDRRAQRGFDRGDAEFLRLVVDQVVPVIGNLRLVDRLAEEAACEERRRIALDMHDSVIQPYLGLRLGLAAARTALAAGRAEEGAAHVARLLDLADVEIDTLRGYVRELRIECAGGAGAFAAIRRFCQRFSEATGIRVEVTTPSSPLDARLGPEVIQLVAEALSNVRRHTRASRVHVRIEADDGGLRVAVENDGAPPGGASFVPRSLAERAASLGGRLVVERPAGDTTTVNVLIPLASAGAAT